MGCPPLPPFCRNYFRTPMGWPVPGSFPSAIAMPWLFQNGQLLTAHPTRFCGRDRLILRAMQIQRY